MAGALDGKLAGRRHKTEKPGREDHVDAEHVRAVHEAAQLRVLQIDLAARRHPARHLAAHEAAQELLVHLWYESTAPLALASIRRRR